jgi:hypothetical protein
MRARDKGLLSLAQGCCMSGPGLGPEGIGFAMGEGGEPSLGLSRAHAAPGHSLPTVWRNS